MEVLTKNAFVQGVENFKNAADYSSIDLHLSSEGYKMVRGAIKPCGEPPYLSFIKDKTLAQPLKTTNDGHFELNPGACYAFRLKESLSPNLCDSNIYGQATAKSTVGRVDVIARLIVDGMYQYDSMNPRYLKNGSGMMFLEIIPISFDVRVKEGAKLSQLRLFHGKIENAIITDSGFIKSLLHGTDSPEGYLSVDLSHTTIGGCKVAAFRARKPDLKDHYIDLWKKPQAERHDPCQYWCFDKSDDGKKLKLHNGEFYLLKSKERITLPAGVAVYCRPMDETLGEMRIHYAGFVHPYFGIDRTDGKIGTPLIFEVRAHNVDVTLADGERLAKLVFYRMSKSAAKKETPEQNGEKDPEDDYGSQELELSKYFRKWPAKVKVDESGRVTQA